MLQAQKARARCQGLTIIELTITATVLSVVLTAALTSMSTLQTSFTFDQRIARVTLEAESTMDRIRELLESALTTDSEFTPMEPNTGVDSRILQFRLFDGFSGTSANYETDWVFLVAPNTGATPSNGICVGRGWTMTDVHATGAGTDQILGTNDDVTSLPNGATVPTIELLATDVFAPSTGNMLSFNVNGRLVTVTLRMNMQNEDGSFVLNNDVVISERVALRQ